MKRRLAIVALLVLAIALYFALDLGRFLDLAYLKSQHAALVDVYRQHPVATLAAYFLLYVAVMAASLPGGAVLTLASGALFGFWTAVVVVSFASTLGALLAMLASRYVVGEWVQKRFAVPLAAVNAGMERDGVFYLLALRLVPAFPLFLVNLAMGLTRIGAWTYTWVSQLGMLPGTMVYVYLGTQLARIDSLRDLLSPALLLGFALLGLLPLVAKRAVDAFKARRVYARWSGVKPARFDYNMVVVGAGSAGLVSAYIGAVTKAKVALVERERMGGDCLYTGCVPSKALIRSARLLADVARSRALGIDAAQAQFNFAAVMQRVQRVIQAIEPHDSPERYGALGVDCIQGQARLTSPWTVEVTTGDGQRTLTTKSIVIAAGAKPLVPDVPGLADVNYLTSDTVWTLAALPAELLVLGGGPIGCELAQAFARFGSRVTLVEMQPRLLAREDDDVSARVLAQFEAEGMRVLTGHTAVRFEQQDGERWLVTRTAGDANEQARIRFDAVLVAIGRVATTTGYGLEELGIGTTAQRTLAVDEWLQTAYPNITACGDVAGPYQFTHTAAHQAWYAAVNALFGSFRRFRADYRVIPAATFVDPEVARVGLNEREAAEQKVAHDVTVYDIADLDRAIADEAATGFVKVLTVPGSDRILGVTIVGAHAAELIAEFVLAMKHDIGLNRILATTHIYPTFAEANKYAAGAWKRRTVTRGQQRFLAAFQAWRRGAGSLADLLRAVPALLGDKQPAPIEAGHAVRAPDAAAGQPR